MNFSHQNNRNTRRRDSTIHCWTISTITWKNWDRRNSISWPMASKQWMISPSWDFPIVSWRNTIGWVGLTIMLKLENLFHMMRKVSMSDIHSVEPSLQTQPKSAANSSYSYSIVPQSLVVECKAVETVKFALNRLHLRFKFLSWKLRYKADSWNLLANSWFWSRTCVATDRGRWHL